MNISATLWMVLSIACVLLFLLMLYCNRRFKFPVWKVACLAVYAMATGLITVKFMYFIENGTWGGLSFFGGVLLMPACLLLFAAAVRLPYLQVMDISSPGICFISAIMKCQCLACGCCTGRLWFYKQDGNPFYFPSREVELAFALLLMGYFLYTIAKGKHRGKLYPLFMILYGAGRFILNFFRATKPFVWILPAGHFWALISIALGALFLVLINKRRPKNP